MAALPTLISWQAGGHIAEFPVSWNSGARALLFPCPMGTPVSNKETRPFLSPGLPSEVKSQPRAGRASDHKGNL